MDIPGSDAFPANVPVIDDGDTCSNSEHGATAQALADRTKYLANRIAGAVAAVKIYYPASHAEVGSNADWDWGFSNSRIAAIGNTTAPQVLRIPLHLPPAGKITAIGALVNGGTGHAGLPAGMPAITLFKDPFSTSTTPSLVTGATAIDASASLVAYEAQHLIEVTGLTYAIEAGMTYEMRVNGESSTNALAGQFNIQMVYVEISPS